MICCSSELIDRSLNEPPTDPYNIWNLLGEEMHLHPPQQQSITARNTPGLVTYLGFAFCHSEGGRAQTSVAALGKWLLEERAGISRRSLCRFVHTAPEPAQISDCCP